MNTNYYYPACGRQSASFGEWNNYVSGFSGGSSPMFGGFDALFGTVSSSSRTASGSSDGYDSSNFDAAQKLLELCKDAVGSRRIQAVVYGMCDEEGWKDTVEIFKVVKANVVDLSTDRYGNFIVQLFLDPRIISHLHTQFMRLYPGVKPKFDFKRDLIRIVGEGESFWRLTLYSQGCRILQKALEGAVNSAELRELMKSAMENHLDRLRGLIESNSGNHVVQKMLDLFIPVDFQFLIDFLSDPQVVMGISREKFGCRVVQKALSKANPAQVSQLIAGVVSSEIGSQPDSDSVLDLSRDQFGNYVVKEMIVRANRVDRRMIIGRFNMKVMSSARHQYASHVLEAALEYGEDDQKSDMINAILDAKPLEDPSSQETRDAMQDLLEDKFGNYVVQKMVLHAPAWNKRRLAKAFADVSANLQNTPVGRQIIERMQKLIVSGNKVKVPPR